ncbi:MAG: LamB/YcsF family protein [Pikeienuella sp.]
MTLRIDLNSDLGESFGPWRMGEDEALLNIVSSANVACGMHAGDWDEMAVAMGRAVARDVGIGAHPGFPDLQGFGRRPMRMAPASAGRLVQYQIGAAQAMARAAGGRVRHLKLHGALGNMAAQDLPLARACFTAALAAAPDLILLVQAASAQVEAARELGAPAACEIFADRAYNEDGSLVDRREEGAVIHDADIAAGRVAEMIAAGAIITRSGKRLPTRIDTVCLHADTPGAAEAARRIRDNLTGRSVEVRQFEGEPI